LLTGAKDLGTRGSNIEIAKPTKPLKARSTTFGKKTCSKEVSNKKEVLNKEVSNKKGVTTRSKG
jgi:hypothetical protein